MCSWHPEAKELNLGLPALLLSPWGVQRCRGALLLGGAAGAVPGATAPWDLQLWDGGRFLGLPHKALPSDLPGERMNLILDYYPCWHLQLLKAPHGMRTTKKNSVRGKQKKMGPTAKVKWRIWVYYWHRRVKKRSRAISVQPKLFYALSALMLDISIIHSLEENWYKLQVHHVKRFKPNFCSTFSLHLLIW